MEMDKDFYNSLIKTKVLNKYVSTPLVPDQAKQTLTVSSSEPALTLDTLKKAYGLLQDSSHKNSNTPPLSSAAQQTYEKVSALNQSLHKQFNSVKASDPFSIPNGIQPSELSFVWDEMSSLPSLKGSSASATGGGFYYQPVTPQKHLATYVSTSLITQTNSTLNQQLSHLLNGIGSK